jgi:predicted chitinase
MLKKNKFKDKEAFLKLKKDYELKYESDGVIKQGTEMLSIKWAYKYDDKKIEPFKHQTETIIDGQNYMSCSFPKGIDVGNIRVYGYFLSPSENVSVKMGIEKVGGSETETNSANATEAQSNSNFNKITLEQIENLFGKINKDKNFRQEIIDYLNKYIEESLTTNNPIHLDTPIRKIHFFAQVGAETLGINTDWLVETDVKKYTVANCLSFFGDRAQNLKTDGKLDEYCNENPQKKLLNYLYAAEQGFGNGNGNEASGEGYKYRGRGLKQVTGKDNYINATNFIKEVFPNDAVDLETEPDKLKEPKYAVLSAISFWEKNEIWKLADTITETKDEDLKKIRRSVAGSLVGLKDVKKYFEKGLTIFKESVCLDDCSQCFNYADVWENPEISSDNGNKNNNRFNHGSTRGHKGVDILTGAVYKEVHSLMCGKVENIVTSFKTNEYDELKLGNVVNIKSKDKDGNIVYVLYCHLDAVYVTVGENIKHGQKIALSGSTGNASSDEFPNGVAGKGIKKEKWHCHIEATADGANAVTFYGKIRLQPENYMKTKFDINGNKI